MRIAHHGFFLLWAILAWPAQAACSALTAGSEQERGAFSRISAIPDVKAWLSLISSRPNVHAAFVPADGTRVIDDRCYWEITLYSDEGSHLHLWNTFFVSATGNRLLIADSEGNPLSIKRWRSNNPVNRTAGNRRRSGKPPRAASGYFRLQGLPRLPQAF